jgi:hypothetical protein
VRELVFKLRIKGSIQKNLQENLSRNRPVEPCRFFIYPTSDLCECPFTIFRRIPCKGCMVLWRPSIYFRRVGRGRAVNQLGYDEINSWTERAKEKNSRLEDLIASYMYICVFSASQINPLSASPGQT